MLSAHNFKSIRLVFLRVYTGHLFVATLTFETKNTVDLGIQRIVAALADIGSRMNLGTTLTIQDISCQYKLTVCTLRAKSLGLGITTVLGGTHSLFMGK